MEAYMTTLTLTNARLIDGTGAPAVDGATVVIVDDKISQVRTSPEAPASIPDADLAKLDPDERTLVRKRYGLGGERPRTPKEAASEMGTTESHLRAMETRILLKLTMADANSAPDPTPASQGAPTIDLAGSTLLPGQINSHVHLFFGAEPDPFASLARMTVAQAIVKAIKRAEAMLRAGITTARDLGGYEWHELSLRDSFASGELLGPRLLCAGKLITMTGGHGWSIGLESDGPDAVRKSARLNLKKGTDCLKFMATGGVLTPGVEPGATQLSEDEMRAGIQEAHNAGKRTASHAQGTTGIKNALRAGIDTIEHGIFLDAECIDLMLNNKTVFVPTLAAPYRINQAGASAGMPDYVLRKSLAVADAHRRSFEMALQAGIPVAAGNDGGTPFNPSEDLVTEARLMVEYGMTPLQAIKAATHNSALALGIEQEVGTIEPGKWADLLILRPNADPLSDITALGKIATVIQRGRLLRIS
jgi:imidazolonepropionase-like amidohydrolase